MPNTLDDKNLEYVMIQNTSEFEQNIANYSLEDDSWKRYIFSENVFSPWESQIFYRSETKLILNNSDERLFLYNSWGVLEDEVTYTSSTKGEALIFWTGGNEELWGEEKIIEDRVVPLIEETPESLEIFFTLQRPSYIFEWDTEDSYICDREEDECKVNFDLRESFSNDFLEKDYICDISFGSWIVTWEENKCNPNTIIFQKGEHEVIFRILDKNTLNIVAEKTIYISHSQEVYETYMSRYSNDISITMPNIIVQSGLEGSGKYFYCTKAECTINLKYEKKHENEECRWRFYPGEYTSDSTRDRCNPGYVTFPEWIFELSLIVYQDGKRNNSKKLTFYVYNTDETRNFLSKQEVEKKLQKLAWKKSKENVLTLLEDSIDAEIASEISLSSNIVLQWTIWKEKILSWSHLECVWVQKCYVNLTGEIESWEEKLSYIWKNNGEEFSKDKNPKWIWIEQDSMIEFLVLAGDTLIEQKNFEVKINNNIQEYIILEEPLLFSEREIAADLPQKKEKISFTQNFLSLKYDGLRISGKAPIWSRVEIYQDGENILSGNADEKWKYRLVSKNFRAGNYLFDTKIIISTGEEVFFKNSWEIELLASDRANWFQDKKSSRSSQKLVKIPQLVVQSYAADISEEENENQETTSLAWRIFMSCIIVLTFLFAAGHLVLRQFSYVGERNVFSPYMLRFATKQKIHLLLP